VGLARTDDPQCLHISVNRNLAARLGVSPTGSASLSAPTGDQPPFRVTRFDGTPLTPHELPLQTAARTKLPVVDAEFAAVRDDGRVVVMQAHAVPLFDERGEARGAIGVFNDISEQRRSAAEQHFLADASRQLSASLDYEETLRRVVALAVPEMADWSVLDVMDADGQLTRLGSVHRDAAAQAWLDARSSLQADPAGALPLTLTAIAQPSLMRQVNDDGLRALGAAQWQIDAARPLGVASALVVPLTLHGATLGAFAWMRGQAHAVRRARSDAGRGSGPARRHGHRTRTTLPGSAVGQPPQGRVRRHALPRAAHAAQRTARLDGAAALGPPRAGTHARGH
jgi:hypothetical protein